MSRSFWRQEDLAFLKENYPFKSITEIGKILGRSYSSIGSKVSLLGIRKTKEIVSGQIFAKLTVLSKINDLGPSKYICQCECGNQKVVKGANLNRKHTRSCGCLGAETSRKMTKPAGAASFTHLYGRLRSNARNKGRILTLTLDQHRAIITQRCSYCGQEPSRHNRYTNRDGTLEGGSAHRLHPATVERATIYVNTVDRVNSSIGYTPENCVPACWDCNRLKSDFEEGVFLKKVREIFNFQQKKGNK